jgi:hypothetical protein
MKNCIIPVLIFLLFMLVYQCSSAQDYVVTSKRDTIHGTVKPMLYGQEKKVQVTTSDKKKTILPITQTFSFSLDGEIYHPIRTEKGYVFMKLLREGYLSLYAFQMENQMTYDGRYLIKKDGTKLEVPNLGFKKGVTKFISDCSVVAAKVDTGELGKKELNQIIDEYNQCISARTSVSKTEIAKKEEAIKKVNSWDILEEKLKAEPEFEGKKDALDMVSEVKGKIGRSEKVPNFLIDGLKNILGPTSLKPELDAAIKDITN